MKSKSFIIKELLTHCKYTINKISRSTLEEALEYQCYRLDLECIIIEPDYNDEYKRPIAIIPSMEIIDILDLIDNSDSIEPSMIDVLVLPITKKIEQKFNTTIGGRIWSVNKFTSMAPYGILFNKGTFFDNASYSDLKYRVTTKSNIFNDVKVTVIKL